MKGLKALASSTKYSGQISLRLDRFLLHGNIIEKEIVEHRDSVGILPIIEDKISRLQRENVILVTQYRRAADDVLLEIPAGKIEQGETALQAAKRELAEEIGYRAGSLEPLVKCYLAPGYDTEFMTIFIARKLTKTTRGNLDDDEDIEVKQIGLQSALKRCYSGEICDCKTIAALAAYITLSKK